MLLAFGIFVAALTALSFRPPRRPGMLAFALFFPSWLISELPVHAAVGAVVTSAVLAAVSGPSVVGLALVGATLLGLGRHVMLALRAPAAVAAAVGGEETPPSWRRLATVLPFVPAGIERVRNVPYAIGGRRHWLDVWRPVGVGAGAGRPTLLFIHGGGWVIGDKELQGLCTVQELAAAGWVCFSMNYRLSPRAKFPDHLDDVKQAIAWIRRHGAEHGADPGFLVLCGASAGGHLASLAALVTSADPAQRVQGCVSYYGVYDLSGRHIPYPNRGFARMLLERMVFQRRQADDPQAFIDASPIAQVDQVGPTAPPFLILHGDLDNLVPVEGARLFAERLRAASRSPVTYLELPGGHHAFELFCSRRSSAAIDGVRRYCEGLASMASARRGTSAP